MTISRFIAGAAALAIAVPLAAQSTAPIDQQLGTPQSVQSASVAPTRYQKSMPASTLVQLTPAQEISSKHIEEGQQVAFVTVADVVEGDHVVIPRGSPVQATVTWKTGRAIGGKSGKFEVRFDQVQVGGRGYPMSGVYRQEGRGNSVGALLGSMIITGRSAVMLPGQVVTGFTAAPIPYFR